MARSVWQKVPPARLSRAQRAFSFTFEAFAFDAQGNPSGTVKARSNVTLNAASGAFGATRIRVELL